MVSSPLIMKSQKRYVMAFLLSAVTAALFIVPFIIRGHGILYIIDDFNLQQMPFHVLSNSLIKSGNIFWSWDTDLGSQFIGSYSYYTLGSPFFWLSFLFPSTFTPYLMGPLLILKFAVAGLTSYAYLRRFIRKDGAALIGSMLYAFSGFQLSAILFQFLDVTALFPLLLLGLESLVMEKRRGFFAISVALCTLVSYYFFIQEFTFLLLYTLCRLLSPNFRAEWKRLFRVLFEGILGVGISCVLLLPSVNFLLQNPRVHTTSLPGLSKLVFSWQTYLSIISSVFMPAQMEHQWSILMSSNLLSLHAFIPLFGLLPIVIFFLKNRESWIARLLGVCAIFALIPILNSLFFAGNTDFYARWYFMPTLIMALASAQIFDQDEPIPYKLGMKITLGLYAVFVFALLLYALHSRSDVVSNETLLMYQVMLLVFGYCGAYALFSCRKRPWFFQKAALFTAVFVFFSGAYVLYGDQTLYPDGKTFTKVYTDAAKSVKFPQDGVYRVDTFATYRNTNLLLGVPSMESFNSTVGGSIFSFYHFLGSFSRIEQSIPNYSLFALRPFLSVKYVLELNDYSSMPSNKFTGPTTMPDLKQVSKNDVFTVYQSKDFIPMGFTFDNVVPSSEFQTLSVAERQMVLLKGLVLNDAQLQRYRNILPQLSYTALHDVSMMGYKQSIAARQAESSTSFTKDNHGFTAHITLAKTNLVFFSVPYDSGWGATVNGHSARIEEVDGGMMAVKAGSGTNVIRFNYMPKGLLAGLAISVCASVLLALYLLINRMPKVTEPFRKFLPLGTKSFRQ